LVNLISNQRRELVIKGKMDVDKAWELTAKMIHAFWAEVYKVHTPATQACLPAAMKDSRQQKRREGPLLHASSSLHYAGIQVKGTHSPSEHGDGPCAPSGSRGHHM
jgi:hypothetical protein